MLTWKRIEVCRYGKEKTANRRIIIACNTATSAACKIMRGMYPDLPLVGIEPAVKPAAQNHRGEKVAVMATPLTLHEEKFKQLVKRYENLATIIPVPCPDLVEYVEKGILEGPEKHADLYRFVSAAYDGRITGCCIASVAAAARRRCVPCAVLYSGPDLLGRGIVDLEKHSGPTVRCYEQYPCFLWD